MGQCEPRARDITNSVNAVSVEPYDRVLKCPNRHWLACYQTPFCSGCSVSPDDKRAAKVSCIQCRFGLCDKCYGLRFESWKKSTISNPPQETDKHIHSLHKVKQKFLNESSSLGQSLRIFHYLKKQADKNQHLLTSQIDYRKSIETRVTRLISICEQIYEKQRVLANCSQSQP